MSTITDCLAVGSIRHLMSFVHKRWAALQGVDSFICRLWGLKRVHKLVTPQGVVHLSRRLARIATAASRKHRSSRAIELRGCSADEEVGGGLSVCVFRDDSGAI
jgi:hypothetical protein